MQMRDGIPQHLKIHLVRREDALQRLSAPHHVFEEAGTLISCQLIWLADMPFAK